MFAVTIIACVLVQAYTATSPSTSIATKPTTPTVYVPLIEYNCMSNHSIVINVTKINTKGYYMIAPQSNVSIASNKTEGCRVPMTLMQNTNNITVLNCSETVYLYVMEEKLSKDIVGGNKFYEYKISCELPQEGIVKVVNASIIKTGVPISIFNGTANFPDVDVTMTIDKPKPTIGEVIQISITEKGPVGGNGHYILPTNCSARGTNNKEYLMLLNNSASLDYDIMTNFSVKQGNSTASLYAFRFVESDSVTLECTVVLCNTMNCTSGYVRLRRAIRDDNNDKEFEVSAEYQIKDFTSGQTNVGCNLMVALMCMVSTAIFILNY